jgi:hypothetical protein
LANLRNYRTIGYRIKARIYRNIGYRTQKKLLVAHPWKLVAKFAADVIDAGGKFAASVVDTGSNFAAGVVGTGGAP